MNKPNTSILNAIAEHKAEEVKAAKKINPLSALLESPRKEHRDFISALSNQSTPAIIAEIKRASPSKGLIRKDFKVDEIAKIYGTHGARCLSVLTDSDYFQGHPDFLALAKSNCTLPVLRKDFIIDSYQIHESLSLQADCILLIVALLDDIQLHDFCQTAQDIGLAVLVESHSKQELERALRLPTPLMGINNRSLHHFTTDLQCSIKLSQMIPNDRIIITESGINTHEDILRMRQHHINTFLIGESLMREADIGKKLNEFISGSSQ